MRESEEGWEGIARARMKHCVLRAASFFFWFVVVSGVTLTILGFWRVWIATPRVQISLHSGSATLFVFLDPQPDWDTWLHSPYDSSLRVGDSLVEWGDFSFYMSQWRVGCTMTGFFRIVHVIIPPPVLALAGAIPLAFFLPSRRLLKRKRLGQCLYCGYDLRFCPSDRCPECGRVEGELPDEVE